jgi:translocation and assembly module TamB
VDLRGGFVPIIRLVAQTTTRTGLNTSIILEGEVTEPKLSVSSIPELPEDEVLAQLLFGRNLSSVTPLQAIQLASAIATLAGRGGGGIVEGFRDRLGLDNFDVTTDDQGNAAVQAGIYLTDQIYTEAILSADETEINLNFDITRDVTLRGSVASDGDNAIGIYFERDY